MLKPNQLALARASLDLFLDRASNKAVLQIARLNGIDETVMLSTVGSVTMGWPGVVSRKVPVSTVSAQIPRNWDMADEVHGILTPHSSTDVYDAPVNLDAAYSVVESLKPKDTAGAAGLDVLIARRGFKYIVTSGHSIFFVVCKGDGGRQAAWVNSRESLDNAIITISKDHADKYFSLFDLFLKLDPGTRISVSAHPSGVGILHLISGKLKVVTSISMPVPDMKDSDGVFHLDSYLCTTPLKRGVFDKLIDKRKEKDMTEPVTFDALAAIAGGAKEGGLKKPVEQASAPTVTAAETMQAVAEPVTDLGTNTSLTTEGDKTVNTLVNKQVTTPSPMDTEQPVKEAELTVIEAFDAVYESLSSLCNNLRDNLKTLKSVIARYRAELRAAKKNPADSAKIEALQKQIDEREQKIKKLERMLKAAME